MPTFETLPRFERDWKNLTAQQRSTFGKVIGDAFVPDLIVPDRPFQACGCATVAPMATPLTAASSAACVTPNDRGRRRAGDLQLWD
jgi:hypothetical protein